MRGQTAKLIRREAKRYVKQEVRDRFGNILTERQLYRKLKKIHNSLPSAKRRTK